MKLQHIVTILFLPITVIACAGSPMIQPQINSLVVAERFDSALRILQEQKFNYGGEHNELLYLLDYAMVLHAAKDYEKSTKVFNQAKNLYDSLYTVSISQEAKTWLMNDTVSPYRGEDFERLMINVIQGLNYAQLGQYDEALVEARDANNVLDLMNQQYSQDQKNAHKADAFVHLFMGILYGLDGSFEGVNNAFISFEKSLKAYELLYVPNYQVLVPRILKEDLLASAQHLNFPEFSQYRKNFHLTNIVSIKERQELAEVFLVKYTGNSPIKHQMQIPIPLPNGYVTKLAFPVYHKRMFDKFPYVFEVKQDGDVVVSASAELVENIEAIAVENLENRRMRVISKAVLRSGIKHFAVKAAEEVVRQEHGNTAGETTKFLGMLYNVTSEQADLRSWQTLPARIHLTRFFLEPGEYDFFGNGKVLESHNLKAGEKKFIIISASK